MSFSADKKKDKNSSSDSVPAKNQVQTQLLRDEINHSLQEAEFFLYKLNAVANHFRKTKQKINKADSDSIKILAHNAIAAYLKAAEKGSAEAHLALAKIQNEGIDYGAGLFKKRDLGLTEYDADYHLQQAYAQANLDAKQDPPSLKSLILVADRYVEKAQAGKKSYYAQAAKCYSEAAAKGDAQALLKLSVLYANGLGVKQDLAQANNYFNEAKKRAQGDPDALIQLGQSYYSGVLNKEEKGGTYISFKQNKEQARTCFNEAKKLLRDKAQALRIKAEQGDVAAIDDLKRMYFKYSHVKELQIDEPFLDINYHLVLLAAHAKNTGSQAFTRDFNTRHFFRELTNQFMDRLYEDPDNTAQSKYSTSFQAIMPTILANEKEDMPLIRQLINDHTSQRTKVRHDARKKLLLDGLTELHPAFSNKDVVENILFDFLDEKSKEPAKLTAAVPTFFRHPKYHQAQAQMRIQSKELVPIFLQHVARGEQKEAEAMLKKDPWLFFQKGDVTDYSGRTFTNISGFQYALWAYDGHMWNMMLNVFDQPNNRTLKESAYGFSREQAIDLEVKKIPLPYSLDGKIVDYQNHYNFPGLISALKKYCDHLKEILAKNSKKISARDAISIMERWEKIGDAQSLAPAHVAHEYCRDLPFEYKLFDLNVEFNRSLSLDRHNLRDKFFPLQLNDGYLEYPLGGSSVVSKAYPLKEHHIAIRIVNQNLYSRYDRWATNNLEKEAPYLLQAMLSDLEGIIALYEHRQKDLLELMQNRLGISLQEDAKLISKHKP